MVDATTHVVLDSLYPPQARRMPNGPVPAKRHDGQGAFCCEPRPSTWFATALLSLLIHDPDHVAHVASNRLMLAVLGAIVEPVVGRWRTLAVFIASGVGGTLMHLLVAPAASVPLVGMSGSLCGLMALAAVARPHAMLGFVVTYIGMNVLGLFIPTPLFPEGTSLACHVGGFVIGSALVIARAAQLRRRFRLT